MFLSNICEFYYNITFYDLNYDLLNLSNRFYMFENLFRIRKEEW